MTNLALQNLIISSLKSPEIVDLIVKPVGVSELIGLDIGQYQKKVKFQIELVVNLKTQDVLEEQRQIIEQLRNELDKKTHVRKECGCYCDECLEDE